jgi:anti-sigma B factor antagonist
MTVKQTEATGLRFEQADRRIVLSHDQLGRGDVVQDVLLRVSESLDAEGVDVIELDLSEMRMISSFTLNELITLNTRAKSCGVRLVLSNMANELRDIFTITRLERMFELA